MTGHESQGCEGRGVNREDEERIVRGDGPKAAFTGRGQDQQRMSPPDAEGDGENASSDAAPGCGTDGVAVALGSVP